MLTLGIESSCDETSIALLQHDKVITNQIFTQEIHSQYGGVVPEIASREHIKKIDRLCLSVFHEHHITPSDLDLIAVTDSPGLAGALLVGIAFAFGLHSSYKIPITGINHLEGHILSVLIENKAIQFPFLALVVSGGHTSLYQVEKIGDYTCLGQTIDDAAGEAFDKIGKLLGFHYPAGRKIEETASLSQASKGIPFPVANLSTSGIDFSFSGLKTAVKYYLEEFDATYIETNKPLICYSFQKAVIDSLIKNINQARKQTGITQLAVVGGVACNRTLRTVLTSLYGNTVFFPSPLLCTDNAAMIAKTGYELYLRDLTRFPQMHPSGTLIKKEV